MDTGIEARPTVSWVMTETSDSLEQTDEEAKGVEGLVTVDRVRSEGADTPPEFKLVSQLMVQ